ncbi:SH2 domain-containing protein 5 [Schistosoma japonicum]|nr:SH2 domain-containing protein 5 [Schistosoma japonicum]
MESLEPISRPADYIGSFLVSGKGHHERAEIVRQKLEAARKYTNSKAITLLISLSGVKVCHENKERVYMAHALRRISYATCDPENLQFAFLAREPKAQPNIQYCHAFVTTTSEAAEELNTIMGEVFRLAYAQQRLNLVSSNPVLLPQFGKHVPVTQVQHTPLNVTHSSSVNQDNSVNRITSSQGGFIDSLNSNNQICMPIKPLPPLPECSASNQISVSVPCEVDNISPNEVCSTGDKQRGNKPHRHKHHRHHRHKLRDATTSTCEQPVGLSDSLEPTALKIVESERIILQSDHLKPPPPPPRSQLPVTSSTQFSPQDVISTNHQGPISKHHEKLLGSVINKNQHEVTEDVAIVLPLKTKSTITPSLQHFYDMADHRSCGGITLDKEVPISEKDIQESSNEFSTDCAPANTSATTTTSSSTTGCSTATSGSGHPDSGSDNSLPMGKRCTCTPGCTNGEHACLTIEKTHPGCDSRLLRPNDQNLPAPSVSPHTVSNVPVHSVSSSVSELSYAPWYLPNLPRDKALEMLAKQPPGSFVIRDSGSHPDSFALSVRSINEQVLGGCFHSRQPQIPVNLIKDTVSQLTSVYPSSTSGITHFLIQKTSGGGVKLKGLDKEWPSLSCLVLHLTVMPEMLPCPLRLPRAAANPTFLPTDHCGGGGNPGDFEKPPNVTPSQFRPMCNALQRVTDTISLDEALARLTDEDEDYQRLSDFSSIMADLKLQPKNLSSKKHKVASSKSGGRGR